MSHVNSVKAVTAAAVLAISLPVSAADDLTVNGYARSSSGEPWTSGYGECVRTGYKDTRE